MCQQCVTFSISVLFLENMLCVMQSRFLSFLGSTKKVVTSEICTMGDLGDSFFIIIIDDFKMQCKITAEEMNATSA